MKILHVIPSISPPLGVPSEVARLKGILYTVCTMEQLTPWALAQKQ